MIKSSDFVSLQAKIKWKPLNGQQKYFYWIYNTTRYTEISRPIIRENIFIRNKSEDNVFTKRLMINNQRIVLNFQEFTM